MTAGTPPPRSRGSLALDTTRCTSCMVCARECPVWCIEIGSHVAATAGSAGSDAGSPAPRDRSRGRVQHVLDRFVVDYGLCMFCGICVDACPFDALAWNPEPVAARTASAGLRAGVADLVAAAAGVPDPPTLDPGAVGPSPSRRGLRTARTPATPRSPRA